MMQYEHLLFIKVGFSVLAPRRKRLALLIPVKCEQRDRESQGVKHLVLHSGQQHVQLLALRRDQRGAQVGVTGDWPASSQMK